jgi:type VI secretion system protein ImpL
LERQRIEQLAKDYAEPLVTWMDGHEEVMATHRLLHAKWKTIINQLVNYELEKPGNSVTRLESSIRQQAKLAMRDCVDLPETIRDVRDTGDFFLERRNRLHSELLRTCRDFASLEAIKGYRLIAEHFNSHLKERFPFADVPEGIFDTEVDADELQAFFRLYDRSSIFLHRLPDSVLNRQEILRFDSQLKKVRAFFAAFLASAEPDPVPVFEIGADFRVDRDREVGGGQIIDWELRVDRQRINFRDPERRARWSPGQAISLTLRWAKDGAVVPSLETARPYLRQDGQSLVYEFNNRWSLLSLLRKYRKGDDPKPHTLRFRIQTEPNGVDTDDVSAETEAILNAQVFIRLALLTAEEKEPLELPPFPSMAPLMDLPQVGL